MTRKITYISGTRADFGLMQECLTAVSDSADLELDIIVTGMHLDHTYGLTALEIESAELTIRDRVIVDMGKSTGAGMALGIGKMIEGFTHSLEHDSPDLLLLLGDRGEMLAGAIAAIHLNIPIVHIHGGERSGTVDEPIRHAISKLAHFHMVATENSRKRLIRMGERHEHIFVVGAPGLSNLDKIELVPRGSLLTEAGFDPTKKVALFLYHPVLTEADNAGNDAVMMLDSMSAAGFQVVALHPNADAGNHLIKIALSLYSERTEFRILNHLSRQLFLSWMAAADVMVGNSSAGIIEAASFGTHVINVGTRQSLRERSANVIDVDIDVVQFEHRLAAVKAGNRLDARNVYGDGRSTIRILDLLRSLPLTQNILMKFNAY